MYWPDQSYYKGEFKDNKKHGQGVFTFSDGSKYDGPWENDLKHGRGKFFFKPEVPAIEGQPATEGQPAIEAKPAVCMKFEGNFVEGEHKDGTLTTADGLVRQIS